MVRKAKHGVDVASLRRDYEAGQLLERDASSDPFQQFEIWFREVLGAGIVDPNAMVLATTGRDHAPDARVVLLKGFDHRGFVFFTNYRGAKGRALQENPRAALLFFWPALARQVRIRGKAKKISDSESSEYFASRPRESQIAAHASKQSNVITDRSVLEKRVRDLQRSFEGKDVPMLRGWGGYCLAPTSFEFWQGRPNRLHDRLRYTKKPRSWLRERLAP